jgi:hypothetical protein
LEKRSTLNAQHQLSAFVVQCWALSVRRLLSRSN